MEQIWIWGIPLGVFFGALIVAGTLAKWLFLRAERWALTTNSKIDDLIIESLRAPVIFLVVYISAALALQFAPTAISSHKLTGALQKSLFIVFLLWAFLRGLKVWLTREVATGNGAGGGKKLIYRMLQALSSVLAGVMILDVFGVSITPLLASLGVGSVAVALALQDTLSNLFAGIYLQIDQPIREGDFVRLEDGTEGFVYRIGWRSTQLRQISNNVVVIPNSKLSSSQVLNFDLIDPVTSITLPLGVSYDSNLSDVETITLQVAKSVMNSHIGGKRDAEPTLRFTRFGDSAIEFNVTLLATHISHQYEIRHEFIKALHETYLKRKIEIPFPQRVVHTRSLTI